MTAVCQKNVFSRRSICRNPARAAKLLLSKSELEGMWTIRKVMSGGNTAEVAEQLIGMLAKTQTNEAFWRS